MSISEAAVVSRFRARSRIVVLSAGLLGAALWSASAQASQPFPSAMSDALGMPCAPSCTICHATEAGGVGTVVKLFGNSAKAAGAGPFSVDALKGALSCMSAPVGTTCANMLPSKGPIDSDGDGVTDIDELTAGNDPNNKGDARICGPNYGCGAHISRVPPARSGTALAIAGSVAALMAFGFRRVSPRRR
jgi:hypothetical protein